MESLLMLRGVREVSALAKPDAPGTVPQRAFDAVRASSPEHAALPPARRITERLGLPWREVLEVAHAPEKDHSFLLGRKGVKETGQSWLTAEYAAFALKLVAGRLNKSPLTTTLTHAEYRVERAAMLSEDHKRWLHGGQLVLPTEEQVRCCAGSWNAALRLAGLLVVSNQLRPSRIRQRILTRVEVIERFHDHYGEVPSRLELAAFARGNGLPMGRDDATWPGTLAEWERRRRERGLAPAPPRRGRRPVAYYSRDVGAARPGEYLFKTKWGDPGACTEWIGRYLAQLGPGEGSTVRGYADWARNVDGAPAASRFEQHGGWGKLRREAQESASVQAEPA